MSIEQLWTEFERRVGEMRDLGSVAGLVGWDREVLMPPKAAELRGQMFGTLAAELHRRIVDPELGKLIDQLQESELEPLQAVAVERVKWERDRDVKISEELARELAEATSRAAGVWQRARAASDFEMFAPELERIFRIKEQQAEAWGYETEPYDAHLENYERGMTGEQIKKTFDRVAAELKPLLEHVLSSDDAGRELPKATYDPDQQRDYCRDLAERLGFDFEAGRIDLSTHPFTGGAGPTDVRITTRVREDDPLPAIMATIHEVGHGLYEQGIPEEWARTSIGSAASVGVHESQSRIWENQVGRSRAFWEGELDRAAKYLNPLADIGSEDVYRAANRVQRSLIRVDADELTYPLHIIQRFDIELAISRKEIGVKDLPAAFDEAMERIVGVKPSNHAEGVLQDIHWSIGHFGYYPTYLIGTILSGVIWDRATESLGGEGAVTTHLHDGDFAPLLDWLRTNIHRVASTKLGIEIMQDVGATPGGELESTPYTEYMKRKYQDLYS